MNHKIKLLSDDLHLRVLGRTPIKPSMREIREMYKGYERANLHESEDNSKNVEIPIPDDIGTVEDVTKAALELIDHRGYIDKIKSMVDANILKVRQRIPVQPGWQMFDGRKWVKSSHPPNGTVMVGDFETVKYPHGRWYPTMFVAVTSENHWYVWQWASYHIVEQTIPIGNNQTIIGHNIPYDRSYFREEYLIAESGNRFFDTMAAFIAIRGMSNQQRPVYKMGIQTEWRSETTTNGLSAVHAFYTGEKVSKVFRDSMVKMTPEEVMQVMSEALDYCATDVFTTWEVLRYVFAEWLISQPSAISQSAQIILGKCWLPISERFNTYEAKATAKYNEVMEDVTKGIREAYAAFCKQFQVVDDLLGNTRWEIPDKIPVELVYLDWTPAKVGKTKGQPAWYRETKVDELTLHSRIVPTILKLKYKGSLLYWDTHPTKLTEKKNPRQGWRTAEEWMKNVEDAEKTVSYLFSDKLTAIVEDGVLSTNDGSLLPLLAQAISCVNWVGLRKRVSAIRCERLEGFNVVVPAICTTGTASRRMADSTWQCAPNAKVKRIGTELKTMIEPPKGFDIVGADVDGQEAWIASLMADYKLGFCGSSTLGLTMLIGSKKYKTDIHTVISLAVGITRGLAKNIFYGLLYGLSLKGVKEYIAKSNATLSPDEVLRMSKKLIREVKGEKINGKWVDGLASDAFNYMERLVSDRQPRSTVLKAALTRALAASKEFQTSKVNWTIQTSGVDFRDILILFSNYFMHHFDVQAKLLMTIHDEVRYMVPECQSMKAAHALQLAHLYTRAMFIDAFGLDGIPQSCAWFSGVDVDQYWRKASVPEWTTKDGVTYDEANAACITPSQDALPYAKVLEPIDIYNGVVLS